MDNYLLIIPVTPSYMEHCNGIPNCSFNRIARLQIRLDIEDNSKVIFLSQ